MQKLVTQKLINYLRNRFAAILNRELSCSTENLPEARKLDVESFSGIIVWYLLVPFFVNWASSISLAALKKKIAGLRSVDDAKKEITMTIGCKLTQPSQSNKEELKKIIQQKLILYGVSPLKATKITLMFENEVDFAILLTEYQEGSSLINEEQTVQIDLSFPRKKASPRTGIKKEKQRGNK